MKKYLTLALLSGFVLYSGNVNAQMANTTSGHTSATIIADLSITETEVLDFGTMLKGAGDVTINTAGLREGSKLIEDGTDQPGEFTITGEPSRGVIIAFSEKTDLGGPEGQKITLKELTAKVGSGSETAAENVVGQLNGEGMLDMTVGGTINVGDVPAGEYSGTYTVTVNYQ